MKSIKLVSLFLLVITMSLAFVSCKEKEDFKSEFNEQAELLGLSGIPEDAEITAGSEYTTEIAESVDLTVKLDNRGAATSIVVSSDKDDSAWKDYANSVIQQYKSDNMNPSLVDMLLVEDSTEKDGYNSSVKLSDTALARVNVESGVRTLEIVRTVD